MCSRGGDPGPARDNSSCRHSQYLTTDGVIFEASKRLFASYSMQMTSTFQNGTTKLPQLTQSKSDSNVHDDFKSISYMGHHKHHTSTCIRAIVIVISK
jgi:hypothetical protein